MLGIQKNIIFRPLKKAFITCVCAFLILNCFFPYKNVSAFTMPDIDLNGIIAVQQNALGVSMNINRAVTKISNLFSQTKTSNILNETVYQQNAPVKDETPVKNDEAIFSVSVSGQFFSSQNVSFFSHKETVYAYGGETECPGPASYTHLTLPTKRIV